MRRTSMQPETDTKRAQALTTLPFHLSDVVLCPCVRGVGASHVLAALDAVVMLLDGTEFQIPCRNGKHTTAEELHELVARRLNLPAEFSNLFAVWVISGSLSASRTLGCSLSLSLALSLWVRDRGTRVGAKKISCLLVCL